MKNYAYALLALLVAVFSLPAQSAPNGSISYYPVGYELSPTNSTLGTNSQVQEVRCPVAVQGIVHNGGTVASAAYRGFQIVWMSHSGDLSQQWAGAPAQVPYDPWFVLDFYNASAPPTPWAVPWSVSNAEMFYFGSSAVLQPWQWVTSVQIMGSQVPFFIVTYDVPNSSAFSGIELMSQWVRPQNQTGMLIWSRPWIVRIL